MAGMNSDSGRLSFTERLGYGFGDTASNFFFVTFNIFLLYYYTDVFGISAAAVGTMFLVSRLWDAINDPLMGAIADRTETRFGKFRPWLLWMAVPYGVMGCLVFAGPDFSDNGKLLYAWGTYMAMMMLYTAINVPYSALMGVMTPLSKERTMLATFRFVGAFGGGLLISMLVRPMVKYFGVEDEAAGFRATMAVFAIASILMFWFTFATTRERVETPAEEKVSLQRDFGLLLSNRPWIVLCFAGILTLASIALKQAVTVHYFKYYVMDSGDAYFWIWDLTSLFLFLGGIFLILGVCYTNWLTDRFEKKSLLIVLSLVNAVLSALLFIVPPESYWTMVFLNCLTSFIAGPTAPIVWSMYGDVADFGEWRSGRRTTGLVFSASMFAQKFGLAIGAGLSGWLLDWFGYVANEAQSDMSLMGIRWLFTLIPSLVAILNVVVLCFYFLPDSKVAVIERELAERKSARALAQA